MTVQHILVKRWASLAPDLPVILDDGQDPLHLSAPWFDSFLVRSALNRPPEARHARLEIAGINLDLELQETTEILRRPGGEPMPFACAWSPSEGLLKIETDALDTCALFQHVQANFGENYIADDQKFQRHAQRAVNVNLSGLRFRAEFRFQTFGFGISLWPLNPVEVAGK